MPACRVPLAGGGTVNSVNAEPESPGRRPASAAAGPDVAGLVFDGERLQCAECGGWYRHLATHVFLAHGLLAQDYRAEHGLPASVPLVVADISDALREGATARGTEHLDQWRRPGPERDELVDKLRETKREQADEYWAQRLAEVLQGAVERMIESTRPRASPSRKETSAGRNGEPHRCAADP